MIGLVLAAGAGRRLRPLTDSLPKTLIGIDDRRTILDVAVSNLAQARVDEVIVMTGFRSDAIESRIGALEDDHGVPVHTLHNDRGEIWNNAYSLWLAREYFEHGVILVNGDTVHPPTVESTLLAGRGPGLLLAVDEIKRLGAEEMKVQRSAEGRLQCISKRIAPPDAHGEYIGVSVIEPFIAGPLADALQMTWKEDPTRYYEDGFQRLTTQGDEVFVSSIGDVDWVEVDDIDDLTRAREIACRC